MPPPSNILPKPYNVSRILSAICSLIFRRGMIDVDFVHLRNAFNAVPGVPFWIPGRQGRGSGAQSLERTYDLPHASPA